MASTPAYTPSIDVAFKQRLYDKVGKEIGDSMVRNVTTKVSDNYLVNGDQRVVLPDVVLNWFEVDPAQYALFGIMNNGICVEKTQIPQYIRYYGKYKGVDVWAYELKFSSFGFDPKNPIKPTAVYDAPTDNDWGRGVAERGVEEQKTAEEITADTSTDTTLYVAETPKKGKKR